MANQPTCQMIDYCSFWAISELPLSSVSKGVVMQKLSFDNEFDFHEHELYGSQNAFSCHKWFCIKGPLSTAPLLLFTCKSLAITFCSEGIETKETTVKLQQIIKHTFRNTTYSKSITFRFTMQYQ